MQSVNLNDLDKYFTDLLKKVPEERRAMFEEIAQATLTDLRGRIGGAGKVQRWQDKFVGSGGGYAAVRPKAKTYTDATGKGNRYAVGYVTNAITGGHRTPKGGYVPGKGFYAETQAQAEKIAWAAMERFERRIQEAIR